ncbi:MAG: flavin reductase family protein [Ardenticatenia bacterium]|nr:MAG: flavin reductase family protein [Ardenticatenia bacterium]
MERNAHDIPWRSMYKLLTGAIVPRPIGWISTVDVEGRPNLAPFSFFNAICSNPPHLLFCPGVRSTDGAPKDTLRNVRATGEFVVNIVTEDLLDAMNLTSTELPPDVDEFAYAGLTPTPSVVVRPPRVAESPIHFECRVVHIYDVGHEPGAGSVVIGEVVHVHVADDLLLDGDKIDIRALKPVGRLAGGEYCLVREIVHVPRPPSRIRPSHT